MTKIKSKDFKELISRLEKDNKLHREKMAKIYNLDIKERTKKMDDLEFHRELIGYHNTMINYIKKLDCELYEGGKG